MGRGELYPFRYKHPITGKWVRARYRATLTDIAARYATWEVTGRASVTRGASIGFDPYRKVVPHAELTRITEPAPCRDHTERMLRYFFVRTTRDENGTISIFGDQVPESRDFRIPGAYQLAAMIQDAAWKDTFVQQVREDVRTLELYRAWRI